MRPSALTQGEGARRWECPLPGVGCFRGIGVTPLLPPNSNDTGRARTDITAGCRPGHEDGTPVSDQQSRVLFEFGKRQHRVLLRERVVVLQRSLNAATTASATARNPARALRDQRACASLSVFCFDDVCGGVRFVTDVPEQRPSESQFLLQQVGTAESRDSVEDFALGSQKQHLHVLIGDSVRTTACRVAG